MLIYIIVTESVAGKAAYYLRSPDMRARVAKAAANNVRYACGRLAAAIKAENVFL